MGYDIINSLHIHVSLKQKRFPFSFNGFFMATLQPMDFQNFMDVYSWTCIHGIFMVNKFHSVLCIYM